MGTASESINIDDAYMVQQCQDGDSVAMERLILKYQDRIFNTILRICGNRDDAVELTQDTFVKVLENIRSFHGNSSFYTWLFRIGVNLTLNHCKRNIRRAAEPLDGQGGVVAKASLRNVLQDSKSPDPARIAQDRELCELVNRAIEGLSSEHRAVIVLRDIEGMDYAQIAQALGVESGTVKSRLSRARSCLREILETVLK